MVWPALTVVEMRADGDDGNGGAFKEGGSGTDRSQQATAHLDQTDLEIHSTDSTKVKDVAGNLAVAASVDNYIYISSGTGFDVDWYHIVSQDGTWVTLDHSAGTAGSTGGSFRLGGAIKTPGGLGAMPLVDRTKVWMKDGDVTVTSATANVAGGVFSITSFSGTIDFRGYQTTRGDLDDADNWSQWSKQPKYTFGSGVTGAAMFTIQSGTANGITMMHVDIDCNNQSGSQGVVGNLGRERIIDVRVSNSGGHSFQNVYCVHCISDNSGDSGFYGCALAVCWAKDSTDHGVEITGRGYTHFRVLVTGAGNSGFAYIFDSSDNEGIFIECAADNCGGDGLKIGHKDNNVMLCIVATNNGGYGVNCSNEQIIIGYVDLLNTSGRLPSGYDWIDAGEVSITADPWTGGGDYTLNNTTGGGAVLRNSGLPFPDHVSSDGSDLAPTQHTGAGGSTEYVPIATRRRMALRGETVIKRIVASLSEPGNPTTEYVPVIAKKIVQSEKQVGRRKVPVVISTAGAATTEFVPIPSRKRRASQADRPVVRRRVPPVISGGAGSVTTEYVPIPGRRRALQVERSRRTRSVVVSGPSTTKFVPIHSRRIVTTPGPQVRSHTTLVVNSETVTATVVPYNRRRQHRVHEYIVRREGATHQNTVNQTVVINSPRKVR